MSDKNSDAKAEKRANWVRYVFWLIAIALAVFVISFVVKMMNKTSSSAIPDGYTYIITEDNTKTKIHTAYYIYEGKIFVESKSLEDGSTSQTTLVYDDINTSNLKYKVDDITKLCEPGSCRDNAKALSDIKKIISSKVGREYVGLV